MELTHRTGGHILWVVGFTLMLTGRVLTNDVDYAADEESEKEQNERLLVKVTDSTSINIQNEDFVTIYAVGLVAGAVVGLILFSTFAVVAKRRYGPNLELWDDRHRYGHAAYHKNRRHPAVHRRSSDRMDWDSLKVLDYISMMEEMWRKFDVKEMACQKRVLCELHQNEAALGPAATKIVNMFGYLRYLSLLSLPGDVKSMMEEYLDAADKGRTLKDQTCGQVFDGCQFSIKETFLKYLPAEADAHQPDDNHLPE